MTTQELKQQAREEFEKRFVIKDQEGNFVVASLGDIDDKEGITLWRDYKIKSFIDSIIDRTIQQTEERIVGLIEEEMRLGNATTVFRDFYKNNLLK